MVFPITFAHSDGNSSHTTESKSGFEPCDLEQENFFKTRLCIAIAPRIIGNYGVSQCQILDLPDGYKLWQKRRKNSAQVRDPTLRQFYGLQHKIDKSLFGHPSGYVFRSSTEFAPHALWLANSQGGRCACVGCNKTSGSRNIRPKSSLSILPRIVHKGNSGALPSKTAPQEPIPPAKESDTVHGDNRTVLTGLLTELRREKKGDVFIQASYNTAQKIEHRSLKRDLESLSKDDNVSPRVGEVVLYSTKAIHGHETSGPDVENSLLSKHIVWKAGIITHLPQSHNLVSLVDHKTHPKANDRGVTERETGFHIELMPNINSDNEHKQPHCDHRPGEQIQPFSFYREILSSVPLKEWDKSIFNALKIMSTFSLVLPIRLIGHWPDARILYHAIYLGSELIIAGDTVRLAPTPDEMKTSTILLVTSIVLTFAGLDLDPPYYTTVTGDTCKRIEIRLHGKLSIADVRAEQSKDSNNTHFHLQPTPPPFKGFHPPNSNQETLHAVPLNRVLGKLYAPDSLPSIPATIQSRHNISAKNTPSTNPDLQGILEAREYARKADQRTIKLGLELAGGEASWHWADDRFEALGMETR